MDKSIAQNSFNNFYQTKIQKENVIEVRDSSLNPIYKTVP